MAYNPRNINVLDLRPSVGVGVAIPFNQATAFRTVYTTQEQTKYNIINYLLTEPGERVYEPFFGLGLRRKLFEQMTAGYLENLKDEITTGLETYFKNIEITDLTLTPYPNSNIVNISFAYKIIGTGAQDQITITLENV